MAEVIGPLTSFVLDYTKEYFEYNANLIGGANENVHKLVQDMEQMKLFVKECTETYNDEQLEMLAGVVQGVVAEAENTIEKYFVYAARQKIRGAFGKVFHWPEHLLGELRDVGKECQGLRARMKELQGAEVHLARKLIKKANNDDGTVRTRKVYSPDEDNIIGFEDVAKDVKNLLTGNNENLEVHSIVGMVGLGKTTLARKVYNDPEIEHKFFARAFVVVSEAFDKKEVFSKILGTFAGTSDEINKMNVDTIKDKIIEQLKGKAYLIVLDDVWYERNWDDLQEAFPRNQMHSRVLITTRDSKVATHANKSDAPYYSLRYMNDIEDKALLRFKVFGEAGCPPYLESKIEKPESLILKNCGGLPLAIVVVAGILMHHNRNVEWWDKICERVKKFEHIDEQMSSDIIQLSFKHLPYYVKPCFLYLGIFPEDFDIPVWKLIRLWIAEGFIKGKGNPYDIAEGYLEELVDRNLVMVAHSKWNGEIKTCRVHDFLRAFCKEEAMNRNIFQEYKGMSPVRKDISVDKYLRISINSEIKNYVSSKPSGKLVRSFLSFPKEDKPSGPNFSKTKTLLPRKLVQVIPKAFELLRVFDAKAVNFETFPSELFVLILLKYLAMSCDVDVISSRFEALWNLQTFIFETKSPTLNIKADIWKMEQFQNLHVNTSATLPVPVQRSSQTQTTSNVQTLCDIAPESCTRQVFERCTSLKKLGIRGKNLAKCMNPPSGPGLFDNFSNLKSLEKLKLINSDSNVPLPYLPDYKKFPSNLKRLTLSRTHLDWDNMDTLGELKNLKVLKVKDKAFVGDFWTTKEGGFSNLSVLHIDNTDLFTWSASSTSFPSLTTLVLMHCSVLKGIPHDFGLIDSFCMIKLHWTEKAISSALEIKRHKVKTQKEKKSPDFKLAIYPPQTT